MCGANAAECHEIFVINALKGLRDGKALDISLLIKHVESIRPLTTSFEKREGRSS